jgi:hypothetical protein
MSIYPFVLEMKKHLRSIEGWLDKASAHATAKKYDPSVLLQTRLSPDMFPLVRQIQATCDQAKYAAARTTAKDPPSHPDTEQSFDELKQRIGSVVAYLDGFSSADFEGVEARSVTTPRWEGKSMNGIDYFIEHAQANFYFHYSMTYALLRSSGVDIGKRDYLGALSLR